MSTAGKIGLGCLAVAAGAVCLVVGIYLVVNLVSVVQGAQERGRLEQASTTRLATALPEVRGELDRVRRTVGRDPDASWTTQRCQFDTDDGGWIVQNYRELCSLDAVAVWKVSDAAEARRIAGLGARPDPDLTNIESCVSLAAKGPRLTFVPARTDLRTSGWCAGVFLDIGETRSIAGSPLERSGDTGLLVAVADRPLLDEDIGCAHWSVLFCDNPFGSKHAFGDPPKD